MQAMIETTINLVLSGLFLGSLYALLSVGMSILFGVSATINLAHGDVMMIGGYITFLFYTLLGVDPLLSPILTLCILGFLATVIYYGGGFSKILMKPIPRAGKEFTTLILTFALGLIFCNFIADLFTPNYQTYAYLTTNLELGEIKLGLPKLFTMLISFFTVGGLWFLLRKTWFGLGVRCVLDDAVSAQLIGVNISKVHLFSYVVGLVTAGIAGNLFSMNYYIHPYMGVEYTMVAFVATILGGIGSVRGAVVGGLIIGLLESFLIYITCPLVRIAVIYSILLITLFIRPKGIFRGI